MDDSIRTDDGVRLSLAELTSSRGGPRFLLVHGFAQNRLAFTEGPLPELLAERGAEVYAGELRGHGFSARGNGRQTLQEHLELDMPALIRAVGPPVHLIGHSMGGLLGYALLGQGAPLSSVTTFGAPVIVGGGRFLVRLAALLAIPIAGVGRPLPMDHFLRALAAPLSEARPGTTKRALQRLTRLASPAHASPEALRTILSSADPESSAVLAELARMTRTRRPVLAGVLLEDALRRAAVPVATVVGSEDVFGGRASVRPFDGGPHAGRRLVVEVEGGTHVDVTIGRHLRQTVPRLWRFLMEA